MFGGKAKMERSGHELRRLEPLTAVVSVAIGNYCPNYSLVLGFFDRGLLARFVEFPIAAGVSLVNKSC